MMTLKYGKEMQKIECTVSSVKITDLSKKEESGVWKPDQDIDFYYIGLYGDIYRTENTSLYGKQKLFNANNAFRTEEEAEREVKRRKVIQRLKELAGGFEPDWGDEDQEKWSFYFNHKEKDWGTVLDKCFQNVCFVYFKSEEGMKNAIKELGDELNVLLEV